MFNKFAKVNKKKVSDLVRKYQRRLKLNSNHTCKCKLCQNKLEEDRIILFALNQINEDMKIRLNRYLERKLTKHNARLNKERVLDKK